MRTCYRFSWRRKKVIEKNNSVLPLHKHTSWNFMFARQRIVFQEKQKESNREVYVCVRIEMNHINICLVPSYLRIYCAIPCRLAHAGMCVAFVFGRVDIHSSGGSNTKKKGEEGADSRSTLC